MAMVTLTPVLPSMQRVTVLPTQQQRKQTVAIKFFFQQLIIVHRVILYR